MGAFSFERFSLSLPASLPLVSQNFALAFEEPALGGGRQECCKRADPFLLLPSLSSSPLLSLAPLFHSLLLRELSFELFAETQRDITPEQAAAKLREGSAEVHYKEEKKAE